MKSSKSVTTIEKLRELGLTSETLYALGMASVGMSFLSWLISIPKGAEAKSRWGLFLGEWAPTFIALGVAMRMDERRRK